MALLEVESFMLTVTAQEALFPPAEAVIVALPAAAPVTFPPETVATDELLVAHVTALSKASLGETVAVRVEEDPLSNDRLVALNVTPVTALLVTVTVQVAVLLPSEVVAVMVAVPGPFAVTVPLERGTNKKDE